MKQKIIVALIGLFILGGVGWKYYAYKHPEVIPKETVVAKTETKVEPSTATTATKTDDAPRIHIDVNPPVDGTYKGVVEVGASGFNSFVVNIDANKNWQLISKQFGKSLAYEGFANTEDVYSQLKNYIADIAEKGVAGNNIHFVISSGALKNPKTALIAETIKKKGYAVNMVTADQEGKYALRALLPKAYTANSFVVDIGSGNTKISWYEGTRLKSVEAPGAKYYEKSMSDADASNAVAEALKQLPTNVKENCFMIGGVPYELAKESRNGEERFTLLKNPEEYSVGDNVKKKSGINIYKTIFDNSGTKNFIFDWDANFTIGFLLAIN